MIFLLQPHYKNFSKRLIKSPKLYFYGEGIASYLLGISSVDMLVHHYLRGGLFESMVLGDLMKGYLNRGRESNLYFWQDQTGIEIDGLIEEGNRLIPIEIKSGPTVHADFFKPIQQFCEMANFLP